MKLIKLELRKNNLIPYLWGSLGIFIGVTAMGLLFSAIPVLEPHDPSSQEFSDPNMIVTMVSIISMSAFSILASIMHSKFVVEEYTGRRNVLLFTFPQKRSSILLAKISFIFTFVFFMMFAVNVTSCITVGVLANLVGLTTRHFTNISTMLGCSFIYSLIANFIGIISLRVGFYKKSVITPIVVATILTVPFGNSVMLLGADGFLAFIIGGSVLLVVSMSLFLGLLKKVNRMECIS